MNDRPTDHPPAERADPLSDPTVHSSPPRPSLLLATLRRETAAVHQRLELGLPLLDPTLTRGRYRAILTALYGFYHPLEAHLRRLEGWDAVGLDLTARQRSPLLRQDLARLGMSGPEIERSPRCRHLPHPTTPLAALGCLYVLEGATLGGQVISRHIIRSLGLTPSIGGAFFFGHGAETRARWTTFVSILDRSSGAPEADEAIVGHACDTFLSLERWLVDQGILPGAQP